jgi:hypothetical protein
MTPAEEAKQNDTAYVTITNRDGDNFFINIAAGNGAMSNTITLGWRAADQLCTALTQHMMDWHFEKNPGDANEATR